MITVYGIKNCDTMKKAFDWLNQNKVQYEFHDYKKAGISKPVIEEWLKQLPLEQVINTKGLTWKKLSDEEKAFIKNKSKAIELMIAQPSMIKRPLVVMGKKIVLGFDAEKWINEVK